ncbi:LacI family DNA-binding transcriptional regulator [Glycomyces salinus]|uniref:LacI family DNA-binding transcriptional regulator n=1 Tax=Glycomyces salinus TaxID=980294 RepID=UPI0018ECEA77|nr:LacI family DNA-binding transcriptional regulator [Glycomyces salinus]
MTETRPPTSHDVARAAGVSQATVSYALTGKGAISQATRDRVLQAAETIGYRPNLAARSMRTRRSGRLALVTGVGADNHMRMLGGAGEAAAEAGYAMETHCLEGTAEDRTARLLELAAGRQFEGILAFIPVVAEALATASDSTPVVTATAFDDQMHSVGDLADASLIDDFITALAAAGYRRFVHLAGSDKWASARSRRAVYLAAVERLGVESLGVLGGDWPAETGRRAVLSLPEGTPPLAVIAANDILAAGVLRGAAERGWSVPGDLVVTGWDNYEFGGYTTPSLTTVDLDFREAGRRAMRLLTAALRGEPAPDPTGSLQRIVWRESTGAAA